jgi:hypothetical protein
MNKYMTTEFGNQGMKLIVIKGIVSILLLVLGGCAIHVTPANFIKQSRHVEKLDTTKLQAMAMRDEITVGLKAISFVNEEGLTLRGIQAIYPDAKVNILLFGDNGMAINSSINILHQFGKIPANVIWFDYQGIGVSDKSDDLSVENLKKDALAAYDFSIKATDNELPTLVHGIALGSLMATYVALNRPLDGLVLDSAVASISELVDDNSPGFSSWLTRMSYDPELMAGDNYQRIAEYSGPLLLLVGDDDNITPADYSQKIYKASKSKEKELVVIADIGHEKVMRNPLAIDAYRDFLTRLHY